MILGVLFCVFVLCPQMTTPLPIYERNQLQDLLSTNIQNLNSRTPSHLNQGLISRHQPSQRLFLAHHQKFSLNKLINLNNIITLSERSIDFVGITLRQYKKTGLFSASEQLINNAMKIDMTLSQYDEILNTLLAIICSADNGLQTIEVSVRDRGHLYGLEKESSRIAHHFQTARLQLQSLQTIISAVHDGGNTQCKFAPTPMIPIQQSLNFNIVKETKQIIQNLTDFVVAVNYTMNDCQTSEILSTFLSRAANLIPGISNPKIYHHETAYIFNQSIRYQWNITEQQLCDVLREIQTVKSLTKTQNSGMEDTQAVDDVISNIQNSLSALGTADACKGNTLRPPRVTNMKNHYQNALMRLNDILFELDSYKNSKFCSH